MRLKEEPDYEPGTTKDIHRAPETAKTKTFMDQHGNFQDSSNTDWDVVGYIEEGRGVRYFAKINRAGFFFNPLQSYLTHDWSYKGVTEQVFNSYRSFLKTKDTLHLTTAERAYQNG